MGKNNDFKIEMLVALEKRQTKKQKLELQEWVKEVLEDKLSEFAPKSGWPVGCDPTNADKMKIGYIALSSDAGVSEICI